MAASEEDVFVDQSAVDRVKAMMADMVGTVSANLEETMRQLRALEARLSGHIDDMNACVLEEGIVMTAATESRNEERDLLRIIKQLAEKRMVRYRDASTESNMVKVMVKNTSTW